MIYRSFLGPVRPNPKGGTLLKLGGNDPEIATKPRILFAKTQKGGSETDSGEACDRNI